MTREYFYRLNFSAKYGLKTKKKIPKNRPKQWLSQSKSDKSSVFREICFQKGFRKIAKGIKEITIISRTFLRNSIVFL